MRAYAAHDRGVPMKSRYGRWRPDVKASFRRRGKKSVRQQARALVRMSAQDLSNAEAKEEAALLLYEAQLDEESERLFADHIDDHYIEDDFSAYDDYHEDRDLTDEWDDLGLAFDRFDLDNDQQPRRKF